MNKRGSWWVGIQVMFVVIIVLIATLVFIFYSGVNCPDCPKCPDCVCEKDELSCPQPVCPEVSCPECPTAESITESIGEINCSPPFSIQYLGFTIFLGLFSAIVAIASARENYALALIGIIGFVAVEIYSVISGFTTMAYVGIILLVIIMIASLLSKD